jgi:site-specific DNA-methyltransferase (adenine-specific)
LLQLNQFYNENCLLGMQKIDDKSIDLIITDLPYKKTSLSWDVLIPIKELWEQYERIIKDNGVIALFGQQPFTSYLVMSNLSLFRYELIWEKDKPSNFQQANKQPMCYHENILIFYKHLPIYNKQLVEREGKGTYRYEFDISHDNRKVQGLNTKYIGKKEKSNYDIKYKNPKSILYYDTGKRQHLLHPTQKPVELYKWLILTYTNENAICLDSCSGSGTIGIAAKEINRNYIGFDNGIDDRTGLSWCDIAQKRIETC